MKPCKLADYFIKKKNIFIMKNLTDFRKTVETGMDPCMHMVTVFTVMNIINI